MLISKEDAESAKVRCEHARVIARMSPAFLEGIARQTASAELQKAMRGEPNDYANAAWRMINAAYAAGLASREERRQC